MEVHQLDQGPLVSGLTVPVPRDFLWPPPAVGQALTTRRNWTGLHSRWWNCSFSACFETVFFFLVASFFCPLAAEGFEVIVQIHQVGDRFEALDEIVS